MVELDSKIDVGLVRRASAALLKHLEASRNSKPSLFENEETIIVQFSLHKIPEKISTKPIHIDIPSPLRKQDGCDMCLFVKDDAKAWVKEQLEETPVAGLTKIIKLQKLRTAYREFKNRRELLGQFDLFLCDDRIMPMLTKALGKTFLSVKKQPVPLRLERWSSLGGQIARARDNTHLCMSHGSCWVLKLANTSMTEDQVVENIVAGVAAAVRHVPKKWMNIKSIHIKSSNSVALPIYSSLEELDVVPAPAPKLGADIAQIKSKKEVSNGSREEPEKKKARKPRPLLRQQLKAVAAQAKAEKKAAAEDQEGIPASRDGERKGTVLATVGKKRARALELEPGAEAGTEAGGQEKSTETEKSAGVIETPSGERNKVKPPTPNPKVGTRVEGKSKLNAEVESSNVLCIAKTAGKRKAP
ncbi:unnamed protein product, partial [Discosporangium mesarthrocarpum]